MDDRRFVVELAAPLGASEAQRVAEGAAPLLRLPSARVARALQRGGALTRPLPAAAARRVAEALEGAGAPVGVRPLEGPAASPVAASPLPAARSKPPETVATPAAGAAAAGSAAEVAAGDAGDGATAGVAAGGAPRAPGPDPEEVPDEVVGERSDDEQSGEVESINAGAGGVGEGDEDFGDEETAAAKAGVGGTDEGRPAEAPAAPRGPRRASDRRNPASHARDPFDVPLDPAVDPLGAVDDLGEFEDLGFGPPPALHRGWADVAAAGVPPVDARRGEMPTTRAAAPEEPAPEARAGGGRPGGARFAGPDLEGAGDDAPRPKPYGFNGAPEGGEGNAGDDGGGVGKASRPRPAPVPAAVPAAVSDDGPDPDALPPPEISWGEPPALVRHRRPLLLALLVLALLLFVGLQRGWLAGGVGGGVAVPTGAASPAPGFDDGLAAYRRGDFPAAARVWRVLAAGGHPRALYMLGYMAEHGQGQPWSNREAARWYRQAAERGLPEAQLALGSLHDRGLGVAPSAAQAAHWYRQAAEAGLPDAQYRYALALFAGEGVAQDFAAALRWFEAAAAGGVREAAAYLRFAEWRAGG